MVQGLQRPSVEAEVTAPVRFGVPFAAGGFVLTAALRFEAMPAGWQERVVVQVRAHHEHGQPQSRVTACAARGQAPPGGGQAHRGA